MHRSGTLEASTKAWLVLATLVLIILGAMLVFNASEPRPVIQDHQQQTVFGSPQTHTDAEEQTIVTTLYTESRAATRAPSPPVHSCALDVVVYDEKEHPVIGASVSVRGRRIAHEKTNLLGQADFQIGQATSVDIHVRADAFYPYDCYDVPVSVSGNAHVVHLCSLNILHVRVTHDTMPVTGATVRLSPVPFYVASFIPGVVHSHERRALTDSDGLATFNDLGVSTYHITALAPGLCHPETAKKVSLVRAHEEESVNVNLVSGEVVTVDIEDAETGKAVGGALANIELAPLNTLRMLPSIRSNHKGQLVFTRPMGTSCTIKILRETRYLPAGQEILPGIQHAKILMTPTPEIRVRVSSPGSGYIKKGFLETRTSDGRLRRQDIVATDDRFRFSGLIVSQSEGFRLGCASGRTRWIHLRARSGDRDVTLHAPARVVGRVVHYDGTPAIGTEVVAWRVVSLAAGQASRDFSYAEDRTVTGATGKFNLTVFAPNLYRVRCVLTDATAVDAIVKVEGNDSGAERRTPQHQFVHRAHGGQTTNVGDIQTMSPGSAEVRIIIDGEPRGFAGVWLFPLLERQPRSRQYFATANPDGVAFFPLVSPGVYTCAARLPSTVVMEPGGIVGPTVPTRIRVSSGHTTSATYVR